MQEVELDQTPTPEEEREQFSGPEVERKRLENTRLKDMNAIRLEYVKSAKGLAETWIGFSIVVTIFQMLKPFGMHLEQSEFVAVSATALGSVIALWAIVGRGVFGRGPAD